jgi:hypothetical protein
MLVSCNEVAQSRRLQIVYYTVIAGFCLAFNASFIEPIGLVKQKVNGTFVCPEYFRGCEIFYIFSTEPDGYSYPILFAGLFLLLVVSVVAAVAGRWRIALAALVPLFAVKVFSAFFMTAYASVPFEMFHLVPCFVLLFMRDKLRSLQILMVVLYVLSGVVKFHDSWISGSYFSTLALGLPLIPRDLIPLATNLLIAMELAGAWWLLTGGWARTAVLAFFLVFHIYSVTLIGFRYPIHCVPLLFALFAGGAPVVNTGLRPACILAAAVLAAFNLFPFAIPGDQKFTYEGTPLSLSMAEANRQTLVYISGQGPDGKPYSETLAGSAYDRISPYHIWFKMKYRCRELGHSQIAVKMLMAVNDHPFKTVVDESDICALEYNSLAHNSWIRLDEPGVGYPGPNYIWLGPNRKPPLMPAVHPEARIYGRPLQLWLRKRETGVIIVHLLLAAASVFFVVFRRPVLNTD